MKRYRNLSHNSGVKSYDVNEDSIDVRFKDGSHYTYPESAIGTKNFEKMERRAEAGKGLATLIATDAKVRGGYVRKRGAKG